MYTQYSSVNLRLPVTNCMDGTLSCDCSLMCEFPLSPSNQLMYESEPLQDQCGVAGHILADQSVLETRVISPSVEGLTFNDYDVLSYVFANEQQPVAAAAAASSSSDDAVKYLSDAWKVTDAGPTLTQLNSEDLDATLLDDFSVSSSGFCVDVSSLDCTQLIVVKPMIPNTTSMPSTAVTVSSCLWPEQVRQRRDEAVQQQLMSQQQVVSVPQCAVLHANHPHTAALSASSATSTTQLNLDRNWEAIESFLKSEDERMATEASNSQQQQQQQLRLAANIKSEAPGI